MNIQGLVLTSVLATAAVGVVATAAAPMTLAVHSVAMQIFLNPWDYKVTLYILGACVVITALACLYGLKAMTTSR